MSSHGTTAGFRRFDVELLRSYQGNIKCYDDMIACIDQGLRIFLDYVGDVTDEERMKSVWYLAHYQAAQARLIFGLTNDNDPPVTDELADLISGDW